MYDSVKFRLLQSDAVSVDFLAETACYLENVGEHRYNQDTVLTGNLNGLQISLSRYQMKVKDGSLCKWYLGDNFQTMSRGDAKMALEKLSDTLHLPMTKAAVTRLDVAQNIIIRHPVKVYLNHLGNMKYGTRLLEPSGLYYKTTNGVACFYDKTREQKSNREPIPELYQGRNVLRYEQRYTSRIAKQLNEPEVTGAMLYDEAFYMNIAKRWRETYFTIQKINDVCLNFEAMKNKRALNSMGILSLVEKAGGELQMLDQINEQREMGVLDKKQAYDLRQAVKSACSLKDGLTVESEAIKELDKKVMEAIKFYR